jgi:protein-S-isoprenylcysteine O-methyltransferase Ste14
MIGWRIAIGAIVVIGVRTHLLSGDSGTISNPAFRWACFAVLLAGFFFAVWARVTLGANWGQPMTQRVEPHLITSGPYRLVRHPIYSGLILAMTATALAFNLYGLIIVAAVSAFFVYSATVEEGNMSARFPEQYPAYKSRSKMIVPFLY